MEKCPACHEYIWTSLENHKCKPVWFCLNADEYGNEIPNSEEFYANKNEIFAESAEQAAIKYMEWRGWTFGDYSDEMQIFVMDDRDCKVYKYMIIAEITREYSAISEPEIHKLNEINKAMEKK